MFDEVLKFGATIVDALVQYKQPVFVYLPPNATLRGGAWAVWTLQLIPIKWRCMLIRSHEVEFLKHLGRSQSNMDPTAKESQQIGPYPPGA